LEKPTTLFPSNLTYTQTSKDGIENTSFSIPNQNNDDNNKSISNFTQSHNNFEDNNLGNIGISEVSSKY
jgi:hypothetical protein